MRTRTLPEKLVFYISVVGLGLSVMGTDRCTEDYSVAGQLKTSTTTPAATTTADATETDDGGDDEIITRTPTPSATPTVGPTLSTPAPTATITPTSTSVASVTGIDPLTSSLAALATKSAQETATSETSNAAAAVGSAENGNWLGKAFDKGEKDELSNERDAVDSDDDGFADWVEDKYGSDSEDGRSTPQIPMTSRLSERLESSGSGATVESLQHDIATGRQRRLHDSDGDLLPDDGELAIGSDPLNQDSDVDGIWDGREVELGTDPVKPEWH